MRIGRRRCCRRGRVARASQSRELISPSLSSQQRPLSLLRWRATAFFLLSMTINPRLRSPFFSLRRPWPTWQQQQCRLIDRFAEVAGICHSLFSPERNPLSGLDIDCESGDPHLPSYPLTDHCPDVRRGQNRSPTLSDISASDNSFSSLHYRVEFPVFTWERRVSSMFSFPSAMSF